jgi:hypothetical protein
MNKLPLTTNQIHRLMTSETSEGFVPWVSSWKTTPVKIIQTKLRDACAVVIRGQAVPSEDFVFPVQINTFKPDSSQVFGLASIELTGHVLVGIVMNNAVSLWDPNGQPFLVERCVQPLATALTNVSNRPIVVGDFSNHPIYNFGPQQQFQSNGYCQSFSYLKVKDLAINGFPGKLEEQLLDDASNLDLDTYVKERFTFWDLSAGESTDHSRPWAGCNMDLWAPKKYRDLAALPNLKMSVWLSGKNVATEATAGSLLVYYKIKPSQWLRLTESAVGKELLDAEVWDMTLDTFFNSEEVLEGLNKSVVPDVKEIGLDGKGMKQYMVTYNHGAFPFHSEYTYVSKKKSIDDVIADFTISLEDGWPKKFEKILATKATPFDIILWLANSA